MAAPIAFSPSERRLLTALLRHKVRFMVVGLTAAAIQGAPVVTLDVDLWFEDLSDPQIQRALKEVGAAYVPPFELNPPMLAGAGAQLFDIVLRMDGLGKFASELRHCVRIPMGKYELPILKIQRILASKMAANRDKDKLVIPVLRDLLRSKFQRTVRKRAARKSRSKAG